MQMVIQVLKKSMKALDATKQQHNSDMDDCVESGYLPEGGLAAMQVLVLDATKAILAVYDNIARGVLPQTRNEFDMLLKVIVAALWATTAQGRQMAVACLTYGDGLKLLEKKVILSTRFKTEKTYKFQPVTLSETARALLRCYIFMARPWAANGAAIEDSQPLLLDWRGVALTARDLGRAHKNFYQLHGIHLTVNGVRKLVESTAANMYEDGLIDLQTRNAVSVVSGHSGKEAEKTYVKRRRQKDSESASRLFNLMITPHTSGDDDDDGCDNVDNDENYGVYAKQLTSQLPTKRPRADREPPNILAAPSFTAVVTKADSIANKTWGVSHPHYGKTGRAIPWSSAELNYVGQFISEHMHKHPQERTVYALCHRKIHQDHPYATEIFHAHHILTTDRVKNGFRSYQKLKAKKQQSSYIEMSENEFYI